MIYLSETQYLWSYILLDLAKGGKMKKGKLIVLEGIDGSGKSSQYRRVCDKLNAKEIKFSKIVFPRYDKESSALIRMYLNGEFGSKPSDVNAYIASTFFAVDRFASYKNDWQEFYESGGIILSDRYSTSNAVHQGAKLNRAELPAFLDWLYDFEFNKIGLPRPDMVLYLSVSLELSMERMKRRQLKTNTVADIHESDCMYLKKCLDTADFAADYLGWTKVDYQKNGIERDIEEKNSEIVDLILSSIS